MGHLINPISLRLGKTKIWNSQWVFFNNNNFINLFIEEVILYKLINRLCFSKIHIRNGLVFSHFIIIRKNNYINLIFYLYNSILEYNIYFLNKLKFIYNIRKNKFLQNKIKNNKIKKFRLILKLLLFFFYNKSLKYKSNNYKKYKIMKRLYFIKGKLFFFFFFIIK